MAELKMALGAVADIASGKEVADGVNKILDNLNGKKAYPKYFKRVAPGTSAASGDLLLDLGGPGVGESWDVRAIVVIKTDPWTAGGANEKAGVYIGQGFASFAANAGTAPIAELEDAGQSLPYTQHYVRGQLYVVYPNHIYVVVHSPAATTAYDAIARLVQFPPFKGEIA